MKTVFASGDSLTKNQRRIMREMFRENFLVPPHDGGYKDFLREDELDAALRGKDNTVAWVETAGGDVLAFSLMTFDDENIARIAKRKPKSLWETIPKGMGMLWVFLFCLKQRGQMTEEAKSLIVGIIDYAFERNSCPVFDADPDTNFTRMVEIAYRRARKAQLAITVVCRMETIALSPPAIKQQQEDVLAATSCHHGQDMVAAFGG